MMMHNEYRFFTIEKLFAYDNAIGQAKQDTIYERQRADRFQQELIVLRRDMEQLRQSYQYHHHPHQLSQQHQSYRNEYPSIGTRINERLTVVAKMQNEVQNQQPLQEQQIDDGEVTTEVLIRRLQQENENLHQQHDDMTATQLQQQQQSHRDVSSLGPPVQRRDEYVKELERQMDDHTMNYTTTTINLMQQQIDVLNEALHSTRNRLCNRETEIDRLRTENEQLRTTNRYTNHHHHQPQHDYVRPYGSLLPISPLSMTDDSVVFLGTVEEEDDPQQQQQQQRIPKSFSVFTTTGTSDKPTHTNTVVATAIDKNLRIETRCTDVTTAADATTTRSCRLSPSSNSNSHSVNTNHTTTTTVSIQQKQLQIRSDIDRATAIQQLEQNRIRNAQMVQQFRQTILLQQQQQIQQQK